MHAQSQFVGEKQASSSLSALRKQLLRLYRSMRQKRVPTRMETSQMSTVG